MVGITQNATLNRTVHLSNIIRAQYASGRISLPQEGGLAARFKHVQGVPASGPGAGYSVSKLQMIDILVERLVQLKGRAYPLEVQKAQSDTDAMIGKLSTELARGISQADRISPSLSSGIAERGMLFSLVA